MDALEAKIKIFTRMAKDRMDEIGLQYTDEQAEQMGDFVNGVVMVSKEIMKDNIINSIKEM